MGKETISCCPSLGKRSQAFPAAPDLQSCVLLLELPLGWGPWYHRDSQPSSSWGLCPGAHHRHCWGCGCCSEQNSWPLLHKLLHPLATFVSCTCSCLYPKHLRQTLSHRMVGKKAMNTIKISTFCSGVFFPLVHAVLSGMPACRKCHGAVSYLSVAASQPSRSGIEELSPASQGGQNWLQQASAKATDQQVTEEHHLNLLENCMVILLLRDVMGSLCQILTTPCQ